MTDQADATTNAGDELRPARTTQEALELLDAGWARFREAVRGYPPERLDEPIGKGWSRKQLLAHIAAWHESASERLMGYLKTGQPQPLSTSADAQNQRTARLAMGRTGGEILHSLEATFARLRRLVAQLEDEQLQADDGWIGELLANNCYRHYAEHVADLASPEAAGH